MRKIAVLSFLLVAVSCGSGNRPEYAVSELNEMAAAPQQTEQKTEFSEKDARQDRKIIREGEIEFQTANAAKTHEAIVAQAAELNGYLSDDSSNGYDGGVRYSLTVRVPAANFDRLLGAVSAQARKIDRKSIRALDVTEEFIDVQARLKTQKELEARYIELLQRAGSVSDVLDIERQIGSLRSEIESVEGRLKCLTDKVAYSSLTITFYEQGERVFGFGSKFVSALESGWDSLLWFLIGLAHLWAFILLGAVLVIVVWRIRKKRKARVAVK